MITDGDLINELVDRVAALEKKVLRLEECAGLGAEQTTAPEAGLPREDHEARRQEADRMVRKAFAG
jgi:hypothetical protein